MTKKELETIQKAIEKSVSEYLHRPATESTVQQVKASVEGILYSFLANGIIDDVPMVDVNHQQELSHLRNKSMELERRLADSIEENDILHIQNELALIGWKRGALLDQIRNPHSCEIFFKNEDTFEPYGFRLEDGEEE